MPMMIREAAMPDFDPTAEQKAVIDSWGSAMAVTAGAGTGKTTTLVAKCEKLLEMNPRARFCAVSFTEKSASDIKVKLSRRIRLAGEGGALSGHWVMTIHALCAAVIRQFPRESGFDGDESMLSDPEASALWSRAIEWLWLGTPSAAVDFALNTLLARESRKDLVGVLSRVKALAAFGAIESLDEIGRAGDRDSAALAAVSRALLSRYDSLKRRRGAMDFDDLEKGASRALCVAGVRNYFHRRFDLVLVDEFQDTNPVQASVISRLAKPDQSNLCVVGDPKQSIYRFRDADVSVFEEFCRKMPEKKSLTWNFRSRPGIIGFVNSTCEPLFQVSGMKYEKLEHRRPAQDSPAVTRLSDPSPRALAAWLSSCGKSSLGGTVLLMRRIRGNEKWLEALSAAGIPVAVGSGGLFWEDPRVREIMSLLKWWDNPQNRLSAAVFMRAPWVGVPDGTLDSWLSENQNLKQVFISAGGPVAQALAALDGRCVRPGELVLALLATEGIEMEIGAQALGLWHRAEELSSRGLGFSETVAHLARAMDECRRDRDVPPPAGSGQIAVLTIHGAKGLEFDRVVLVDFAPKPARARNAPLLFWDRLKGAYFAGRLADGERDKKNPVEALWRK